MGKDTFLQDEKCNTASFRGGGGGLRIICVVQVIICNDNINYQIFISEKLQSFKKLM